MRDTRIALAPYTLAVVLIILLLSWLAFGQTAQSYKPTEVQQLKLQVAQRDAWLAQRDYIEAQRRYQDSVRVLNTLGDDIKKENTWPAEVIFNADKIEFVAPPPNTARPGAPGPPPPPVLPLPKGGAQ
jgi:type II secretory pathway pseudopilin PulG